MMEDEAKTKWCPFSRAGGPDDNRYSSTACLGSGCMAWRRQTGIFNQKTNEFLKPGQSYSPSDGYFEDFTGEGYCGLAGEP